MNYAVQLSTKQPEHLYSSTVGIIASITVSPFYTADEKLNEIMNALSALDNAERPLLQTEVQGKLLQLHDNTVWDLETIMRNEG